MQFGKIIHILRVNKNKVLIIQHDNSFDTYNFKRHGVLKYRERHEVTYIVLHFKTSFIAFIHNTTNLLDMKFSLLITTHYLTAWRTFKNATTGSSC